MSIHTTQIGKHRFICGLFWQSLSQPRGLEKEAVELARKIECDLMVLRRDHATAQAGFVLSSEGARRGALSLAAIVAKTLNHEGVFYDGEKQPAHNWLAAFSLPDGYWAYFAMRDANFLPNGDIAGSKEEVFERLHSDYSLGGWNIVIGDAELEHFGFHNFMARRVEDMLPRKKNGRSAVDQTFVLRAVNAQLKPWQIVAGIGTAALALGALWYGWNYYQHEKELERVRQEIELERVRALQTLAHPWSKQPTPQEFAKACMEKFGLLTPGGWLLNEFVCGADIVSYSWSRNGSLPVFLLSQVPSATIDLNGDKATWSQSLALSKERRDEPLLPQKELLPPLMSRLQLIRLVPKIALLPVIPPQNPVESSPGNSRPLPLPDWKTFSLLINSKTLAPLEMASILSEPGVRLNQISYRNSAWSFEGVIYVK